MACLEFRESQDQYSDFFRLLCYPKPQARISYAWEFKEPISEVPRVLGVRILRAQEPRNPGTPKVCPSCSGYLHMGLLGYTAWWLVTYVYTV